MPEGDAQKKELEQARPVENVTEEGSTNGGLESPGAGASTDAQKKEINEV